MERIVFLINEEFSGVSTYFCAIQFPNDFPGSNDPPARPSTLRAVLHPRGLPDPHGDRPGPRRPCPTCTGRGTEWPASRPGTRHTRWGWRESERGGDDDWLCRVTPQPSTSWRPPSPPVWPRRRRRVRRGGWRYDFHFDAVSEFIVKILFFSEQIFSNKTRSSVSGAKWRKGE